MGVMRGNINIKYTNNQRAKNPDWPTSTTQQLRAHQGRMPQPSCIWVLWACPFMSWGLSKAPPKNGPQQAACHKLPHLKRPTAHHSAVHHKNPTKNGPQKRPTKKISGPQKVQRPTKNKTAHKKRPTKYNPPSQATKNEKLQYNGLPKRPTKTAYQKIQRPTKSPTAHKNQNGPQKTKRPTSTAEDRGLPGLPGR